MDDLFPTLFAKTFFILATQLSITWVAARATLVYFQRKYHQGASWITATKNKAGFLDLHVDQQILKGPIYVLLAVYFATFFFLELYAAEYMRLGLLTFSFWSVQVGIIVALCLIAVDENMGMKVVALTALITVLTALIGIYSGIDFGFLSTGLFIALLLLLGANILRIFIDIPRMKQRVIAGIGVVIFTIYMVHDFNALAKDDAAGVNDWPAAIHISIGIYLDIINLLLELLDAMSD